MRIKKISFQTLMEFIGVGIWILYIAFLIFNWSSIPQKIPGHYNASGMIDKWSDKGSILILPIIAGIMYIGITVLMLFKQIWNVPAAKNSMNQAKVYKCIETMMILFKVEIVGSFFIITYHSAMAKQLPKIFTMGQLLITLGTLIGFTIWSIYISIKRESDGG